jgi:NAD(P)-dependent dehydrogenase (short-subunit alcohol dehydrogenase family)
MSTPAVTPESIVHACSGLWAAGVLKGAVELQVFDQLALGPQDVDDLSQTLLAPLQLVLDALVALGFLDKGSQGYRLTPMSAEFPFPALSAYSASKAGVISITRALAAEVGPPKHPDILINALIPGLTNTEMYHQVALDPADIQEPEAVYPHTRFLVTLPAGGPHGRVFWNSQEYEMSAEFNDSPHYQDVSNLPRTPGH